MEDKKYRGNKRPFNKKKEYVETKRQPDVPESLDMSRYKFWSVYFSDNDERIPSQIDELICRMRTILMPLIKDQQPQILNSKTFILDFERIDTEMYNITDNFFMSPEIMIRVASMIVHETIENSTTSTAEFKIMTRIYNFPVFTPINNIKSQFLGKLIATRGVVSVVEKFSVVPTQMAFYCSICGFKQIHVFKNDLFSYPPKCLSRGCNSLNFLANYYDVKCVEYQKIIIYDNELNDDKKREKSPGNIICLLKSNLVNRCTPGDEISLVGMIKNHERLNESLMNTKMFFTMYIEVNSLRLSHQSDLSAEAFEEDKTKKNTNNFMSLTQEIRCHTNLFMAIVSSFCSSIYGHNILKAALILCLFSGSSDRENSFNRKNAHSLMLGEPGLGKSQLLKALYNVAPKGVYICGSSSSSAGLTVSLVKDAGSNDFSIEPGAVVLANNGICCIDEFDKIPQHHDSLLEVMEQQCVSIAKSGTRCNMEARTTIIAAANFNQGSYTKSKTFTDNICFNHSLLSRFDLIFLLFDNDNLTYDQRLADHVLNIRMNKSSFSQSPYFSASTNLETNLCKFMKNRNKGLDLNQIKSIVAYTRENIHPILDEDAINLIKQYYVDIRKNHVSSSNSIPPTVRKLESLLRLTEARARADLREVATENDVRDVIDIMEKSSSDLQMALDCSDKQVKLSQKTSKKAQIQNYVEFLRKLCSSKELNMFTLQELRDAAKTVLINIDTEQVINQLNDQCVLLKKGTDLYSFVG